MKYLAIDYGEERTGIAISDSGGKMAFALTTLHRRQLRTKEHFFNALLKLIEDEQPEAIVVGMPLSIFIPKQNMAENGKAANEVPGRESLTCRKIWNFVKRLKRRIELPVYTVNEAYSSFEAESRLRQAGLKEQALLNRLDAEAAAVILETFINLPLEQRTQDVRRQTEE